MPSCLKILREEFRLKKFGFGDVHPERFHMWQWRIPPFIYLLYRLVMAVYVDIWMILEFSEADKSSGSDHISWTAHLTNWSYFVLALYQNFHFLASCVHYLCLKRHETHFFIRPTVEDHQNMFPETYSEPWSAQLEGYQPVPDVDTETKLRLHRLPWYMVPVWVLFNIISCAAVMVTLMFFVFLLPQLKGADAGSMDNVQLHMLNSVIIVIEHLVSGIPIRLLHVIYPVLYGLIYMFFSLFYWIPDHERVIYPNILDWNQPGITVGYICLIGFVIFPILQFIYFIIYRVKLAIYRKL